MCTQKLMCNAELRPTCNETSRGFKAIELLVMLGPLFGGDGPDVWPSWKKTQTKSTKKPVNNQIDWKLSEIKHVTCKIKAWLSQETKLDTPSSYQLGKDIMQHKPASQMCNPAETMPQPDCFSLAFKQALSSFRAGAEQFPVAADCLQPGQDVPHHPLCEPSPPLALWWASSVTQVPMHRVSTLKAYTCLASTLKAKLGRLTKK